jgi:phage tail sheath protein FI
LPTYQHPGVYIVEVPSARNIQSAPTSVAAFVGVTEFGPVEQPTLITSWTAYTRLFGGLVWFSYVSWAVYEFFNEGGTSCYIVRGKDSSDGKQATATIGNLTLSSACAGTWGNLLQVIISDVVTLPAGPNGTAPVSPLFKLTIAVEAGALDSTQALDLPTQMFKDVVEQNVIAPVTISGKSYYPLETYSGCTPADLVCAAGATKCHLSDRLNENSILVRATASVAAATRPGNTVLALNGGSLTSIQFDDGTKTLSTVQGISLLALPDSVTVADNSGHVTQANQAATINRALNFCETVAENLFYVIDPPYGLSPQDMLAFKLGAGVGTGANTAAINSSFGAIYYPWIWIYNPIGNFNVPVPPSGAVLGRYGYTDGRVGVHKSPAGVNDGALRTVNGLATALTDSDQDNINLMGINAIRNMINYGNLIWGARTTSMDTEWTYVSVRRFFIFVEQSLKQSLQWVVFEPNSEQLWTSVTRDVTAFLTMQWRQGAMFGDTAAAAFFVTCDASNNPPETRASGELFIDVGMAPVMPAEFVILRLTQKTAGPDSGP